MLAYLQDVCGVVVVLEEEDPLLHARDPVGRALLRHEVARHRLERLQVQVDRVHRHLRLFRGRSSSETSSSWPFCGVFSKLFSVFQGVQLRFTIYSTRVIFFTQFKYSLS